MRIIAAHLVPHWQTEMTDEQKSLRLDMPMVQDRRSKEKKKSPEKVEFAPGAPARSEHLGEEVQPKALSLIRVFANIGIIQQPLLYSSAAIRLGLGLAGAESPALNGKPKFDSHFAPSLC